MTSKLYDDDHSSLIFYNRSVFTTKNRPENQNLRDKKAKEKDSWNKKMILGLYESRIPSKDIKNFNNEIVAKRAISSLHPKLPGAQPAKCVAAGDKSRTLMPHHTNAAVFALRPFAGGGGRGGAGFFNYYMIHILLCFVLIHRVCGAFIPHLPIILR